MNLQYFTIKFCLYTVPIILKIHSSNYFGNAFLQTPNIKNFSPLRIDTDLSSITISHIQHDIGKDVNLSNGTSTQMDRL